MDQGQLLKFLGEKIRSTRKARKLSQESLAELSGLHPTYVSDIELGKVNASIFTYYSLSAALDLRLSELVNYHTETIDSSFENELAEIMVKVSKLDSMKRKMFLSSVKGLLSGIESD